MLTLENVEVCCDTSYMHNQRPTFIGSKFILLKNIVLPSKTTLGLKHLERPISLSKLSAIKNQQFVEYITKRIGDKCACCTTFEIYKALETPMRLARSHTIDTEGNISSM
jgi:hypothetical protein